MPAAAIVSVDSPGHFAGARIGAPVLDENTRAPLLSSRDEAVLDLEHAAHLARAGLCDLAVRVVRPSVLATLQTHRRVREPTRISYRDLLEFFFQIHDPTTLNRQGNDVGASYRSEIFYTSEAQRAEALRTIDDVNASGLWPGRVVTEVSSVGAFWKAEPEHQDYLEHYPHGYTCHFPRPGWTLPRRAGVAT